MDVTQLLGSSGNPINHPPIISGYVSRRRPAPAQPSDPIYLIAPEHSEDRPYGPCVWPAVHGSTLPSQGDPVVFVMDDNNTPHVMGWGSSSTPFGFGQLLPSGADDTDAINAAVATGRPLGAGTFQISGIINGVPQGSGSQGPQATIIQCTAPNAWIQHGGAFGTSPPQLGGSFGGFWLDAQTFGPYLPPPAAPTVTAQNAGGSVLAGTYKVAISYVNAQGETLASAITSVTTTGTTSKITITAPPSVGDCGGWYAYVSQVGGSTLKRQQPAGSPSYVGSDLVLTAPPTSTGASIPGSNTAAATLFISNCVNAIYSDIQTVNSKGNGCAVYGQNCLFEQCSFPSGASGSNGLVLDNGCGGNVFVRVEVGGAVNYDVEIRQTPPNYLASAYAVPTDNFFYAGLFEAFLSPKATLHVLNGLNNFFEQCTFAGGTVAPVLIEQGGPGTYPNFNDRTYINDGQFASGPSLPAIKSGTAPLYADVAVVLQGDCTFGVDATAPGIIDWQNSGLVRIDGKFSNSGLNSVPLYAPSGSAPVAVSRGDSWAATKVAQAGFRPADYGLKASTLDPTHVNSYAAVPLGYIMVMKLYVPDTIAISTLHLRVAAPGSGLTSGQCVAGIYDSQGHLRAFTADQATNWATAGFYSAALTAAGGYTLVLPGLQTVQDDLNQAAFYWAAILVNGTTSPNFASSGGVWFSRPIGGFAVPGAIHRYGYEQAGPRTSLVSLNGLTINDVGLTAQLPWVGVS